MKPRPVRAADGSLGRGALHSFESIDIGEVLRAPRRALGRDEIVTGLSRGRISDTDVRLTILIEAGTTTVLDRAR